MSLALTTIRLLDAVPTSKVLPVLLKPAPAVIWPAPENWTQVTAVEPKVPPASIVQTNPLSPLTVPASTHVNADVNSNDIDLATTGVGASTYQSVTVDTYGRITAGTNPTTLAGYNISDAYTQTQVNNALALKLDLAGGTMSGVIAMGANKITGMADPTLNQDATTKIYVDTILGSATAAATSAAAAAVSETNAGNSATAAAGSATAAAGSATAAAASYDSFDDRYLGPKASDPALDNDGNALLTGALYFKTTTSEMRVYTGAAWLVAYLPASGYLALSGGVMTGAITFAAAQTMAAINGGTGQTSYAVGDLLYASTTTALSKLADIATGNALISGGVSTAPSWGKIDLTTHVSGALPVANGGTSLTTLTANNVILGNGTSAPLFVAPSTSGNVLTSNGTTWQSTTPAASGASKGQAIAFSIIFGL